MSYTNKIKFLEEAIRQLDNQIVLHNKQNEDKNTLQHLIEKKIKFSEEISKLRRLEWEESHERVNIDFDR